MPLAIRLCALAAALVTATAASAASTPAPLSATGLTGMWIIDGAVQGHADMPLTPQAKAIQDRQRAAIASGQVLGEDARKCDPVGMPGAMINDFALEILEIPGRIVMVSEMSPLTRQIYMDKPQSDGGNGPLWNGHSVGHWEGRTLVIDSVNFQQPDDPIVFGGIRSQTLHLIERYHLENGGRALVGDMTFIDPKLLKKPYTVHVAFKRLPNDAELWEYACQVDAKGWSERFSGDKSSPAK